MIEIDGLFFPELKEDAVKVKAKKIMDLVIDTAIKTLKIIKDEPYHVCEYLIGVNIEMAKRAAMMIPLYEPNYKSGGVVFINKKKDNVEYIFNEVTEVENNEPI